MTATTRKRRADKGIRERFGRTHDSDFVRQWVSTTGLDVTRHKSIHTYIVVPKPVEEAPTRGLTFGHGPLMGGLLKHEIEETPDWSGMQTLGRLLPSESASTGPSVQWPSREALPEGSACEHPCA